jgi:hypothetical protein
VVRLHVLLLIYNLQLLYLSSSGSGTKSIEVATGRETEKDKKMALPDRQAGRKAGSQAGRYQDKEYHVADSIISQSIFFTLPAVTGICIPHYATYRQAPSYRLFFIISLC